TATRQAIDHIEYWSERFTTDRGFKPLQLRVLCPLEPEVKAAPLGSVRLRLASIRAATLGVDEPGSAPPRSPPAAPA
ncbi:hypothetical protein NL393_36790, partial [Klebsiella pneumoniae]|nr:hypothetical protein [Klebsiella pneumoniae]